MAVFSFISPFSTRVLTSFAPTGKPPINDINTTKNDFAEILKVFKVILLMYLSVNEKIPQLNKNKTIAVNGKRDGIIIFPQILSPFTAPSVKAAGFIVNAISPSIENDAEATYLSFIISPINDMFDVIII